MTLYLVCHGESDYRLYTKDGTEIGSGPERPNGRTQVDWLAEYHNGASILADPDARKQFFDIATDGVVYRDLTIDGETVPWDN